MCRFCRNLKAKICWRRGAMSIESLKHFLGHEFVNIEVDSTNARDPLGPKKFLWLQNSSYII